MRILQEPSLSKKKILVIDQADKNKNDRTWCFWEEEPGLFELIVHHRWNAFHFKAADHSDTVSIWPYQYKMIRGEDFYRYVLSYARAFPNVYFLNERVHKVYTEGDKGIVETHSGIYAAAYVFNSILFGDLSAQVREQKKYLLLQHFKGWVIETETNCFDADTATFMDFSVSQQYGTTFMYVLPVAPNKALIEYTLFTEQVLPKEAYDEALLAYITNQLNINDYTILEEETGIIPMTNFSFPGQEGKIINIGIAGGQAKASSGFAFQQIQRKTAAIVQSLVQHQHPFVKDTLTDKKFRWYDATLLHVLHHQKMPGDKVFTSIFQKNDVIAILRFLDNRSDLLTDLKIMSTVPMHIFLPAALKEIW